MKCNVGYTAVWCHIWFGGKLSSITGWISLYMLVWHFYPCSNLIFKSFLILLHFFYGLLRFAALCEVPHLHSSWLCLSNALQCFLLSHCFPPWPPLLQLGHARAPSPCALSWTFVFCCNWNWVILLTPSDWRFIKVLELRPESLESIYTWWYIV